MGITRDVSVFTCMVEGGGIIPRFESRCWGGGGGEGGREIRMAEHDKNSCATYHYKFLLLQMLKFSDVAAVF